MNISRRTFLKTGFTGALLLGGLSSTHGLFWGQMTPAAGLKFISIEDKTFLEKIIPVILQDAWIKTEISLAKLVENIDQTIAYLSLHTQKEVRELFSLLQFTPTRFAITSITSWQDASAEEINHFLENWKNSRFLLFRSAYQALIQLVMAAYYSEPVSWKKIGYPGPPLLHADGI